MSGSEVEHLVLVLGDQLDRDNAALAAADPDTTRVLMVETAAEATHVWSHPQRIACFLAAMRHFAAELRERGWQVDYRTLDDDCDSIGAALAAELAGGGVRCVALTLPGEWRLLSDIRTVCADAGVELRLHDDSHFLSTPAEFRDWAAGRRALTMEYFYRDMRRRYGWLMDGDKPAGGQWNYDEDNRKSFGRDGPGELPATPDYGVDEITGAVLEAVGQRFAGHPGRLEPFNWPVTRRQALHALRHFVATALPLFGRYQDAMWQGEPLLYHSRLAAALNLHLLNPREVIEAAIEAWHGGEAPLAAVEGFVRQILGWREFVRGVYWLKMPQYRDLNHFGHERALPAWFWSGDTELNCLAQSVGDTLANAYAHHIQRLMVIGNFSVLAGLQPQAVCDWFLAVYADAVEWVELPNTLGMALHGDGGIVGSKPYVASGAYINRMSNYCRGCRYSVAKRHGDDACPFNYLYWDFIARNRRELERAPRMKMITRNLDRWDRDELDAVRQSADRFRAALDDPACA